MTITPDKIGSMKMTNEGGLAIRLINDTGAPSIKGTIVDAGSIDFSFSVEGINGINPIGVVYEDAIADGNFVWIVISGLAQVLLQDGLASSVGNWCGTSSVAIGRVQASISPPAAPTHDQEVGHFVESKISGVDVLAFVVLHYR